MADFALRLQQLLGERIRKRREEQQLNQGQLADKLHIGRSSISNIEAGRQQPPLSVLYEICNALNIDIQAILPTFTEISTPPNDEQSEIFEYLRKAKLDETVINQIRNEIEKHSS